MTGFTLQRTGNWPLENYQVTFSFFNEIRRNILPIKLPAKNIFRFFENPTSNLDKFYSFYNFPIVNFVNCVHGIENNNFYILSSNNASNATYNWIPSSFRINDCGQIFNYFEKQEKYQLIPDDMSLDDNIKSYAFLINPTKLVLQPTSVTFNSGTNQYTLLTQTKLLSSSVNYFFDRNSELLAFLNLKNYKESIPNNYENLPSTGNLIYSISSYKFVKENPIIEFVQRGTPYSYIDIIDDFLETHPSQRVFIRPDLTYITYDNYFYSVARNEYVYIGQDIPDFVPNKNYFFDSTFNLDFNILNDKNNQSFQLLQSSINPNEPLESTGNTIQTFNWNLSNGRIEYYTVSATRPDGSVFPIVSGLENTDVSISYAIESNYFFDQTTVVDSASPLQIAVTNPNKTWILNRPPHYYSFKVKYNNLSNFDGDTATLNFNLSTGISQLYPSKYQPPLPQPPILPISISYSAFKIKNTLVSNYNYLTLPYQTCTSNDQISFSLLELDDFYVPYLSCLYGPNFSSVYDLKTSPYIPAVSGEEILLIYPQEVWGRLNFYLKASLINQSLNFVLDSKELLNLTFSENKNPTTLGYPIQIEKIFEKENSITISCARLSTTEVIPCRDLRESDIKWSFEPSNPNVTINAVDYTNINNQPLTSFSNGQIIPFNDINSTVTISGYGKNEITISLNSLKYNETAIVKTDTLLFDYFKDNTFILSASNITMENKTAVFQVSAQLLYENSLFEIPESTMVYWTWLFNSNSFSNRVTAYKLNNDVYNEQEILKAQDIDKIKFKVLLEDNDNLFDINNLNISLKSNYKDRVIIGNIDVFLNDFPDPSIFNVDFSTSYFDVSTVDISNTRNKQFVITRPQSDINKYYFNANKDVLPNIIADSIVWIVSSNHTTGNIISSYSLNPSLSYQVNSNATITLVTLSAFNATINDWPIKNNISTTITLYTLPDSEFLTPLEFLIFPPYTWEQNKNGLITLLNNSNYTLAYAPTAYSGKLSNSQDFYVSASKDFIDYDYHYGFSKIYISTLDNKTGSIDIPYHQEFYSNIGTTISLTGYNDYYPRSNGIAYSGLKNISNGLYLGYFPITANTIPFSSVYLNTLSSFKQNPKLVPYDSINLNFTPKLTSIDLDDNIFITIDQTITPNNSSTSPVRGLQENFNGSITYTLSCKYWESQIDVSPVNGTYDLFILRIGDPSQPLYIKDSEITTLSLKASGFSPIYIPDSTFLIQNEWIQKGLDIQGSVNNDQSGTTIALNAEGDIVAIGSINNDQAGLNRGQVRIYRFNGGKWIQQGSDIYGEANSDNSGRVSLNAAGDIVAIGATNNDGNGTNSGHVRVYQFNGTNWVQLGSDLDGEVASDSSGRVSLNAAGDIVAIGASGNDGNGTNSGHVRVYQYNNTTWTQLGLDIDGEYGDGLNPDNSGISVSLNSAGNIVAIGATGNDGNGSNSGHVRVYKYNGQGNPWVLQGLDIEGESVDDLSGTSVSLNSEGDIVAIGAPFNDGNGTDSGHVRIYKYNGQGNPWIKLGSDIDGEAAFDQSGVSVALNATGDIVVIGSPLNDGGGANAGHVRVFKFDGSNWNLIGSEINSELDSRFGTWVAINGKGDVFAASAIRSSGGGSFRGSVRVYEINKDQNFEKWAKINQPINVLSAYTLFAYSTSVKPKIFVSSYYTTTSQPIYIQFETPENSFNYKITSYDVFFGDGLSAKVLEDEKLFKTYDKLGAFNLSYTAYYSAGGIEEFKLETPIFVYPYWSRYDQSKIRLLNEIELQFNGEDDAYTLDQIDIQPNEWGDSDIFNTAISRLNSNFEYLLYNAQTINTDTPTLFYGWLGTSSLEKADGIKWHTVSYNKTELNSFENITDLTFDTEEIQQKFSSFKNIKDSKEIKDRIYVLDNNIFRAFSSSKIPIEINFENKIEIDNLLINPVSIESDETGENVYISDVFQNKVFKLNIDYTSYPAQINLQLVVGNLGERSDTNKFNSPSEIVYQNENLFVLDYNNRCIKQYTKDLNWVFTYYIDEFETEQPINIAIHPDTLLIYVLTENYKIYILDYFKNQIFETIDLSLIKNNNTINKIFFDYYGDFIYILDSKNIFKYTSSGLFINKLKISNEDYVSYVSGKSSDYQSIIINTKSAIFKMQDILNIFKIGDGLSYNLWSLDQLKVNRDEFPDDITYNRSLNRMAQNIKSFRNVLDSRFVIVTEQTNFGTVQYFSLYPVSYQNRPVFSNYIEEEKLGVGVNEFHIPQVINRELKKIYDALLQILDFLNIKDVRLLNNLVNDTDSGCEGIFCWSWKAMSCYNLSLPIIRVCNINPITYEELEDAFPNDYIYAPQNKYGQAISNCCDDEELPI
jgi:hypothetical protein